MEGTTKMVMPFEKFEKIMNELLNFKSKRERISNFIETEIATSSFCVCDIGSELEDTLMYLLADEFSCWFGKESKKDGTCQWWTYKGYGLDNDIAYWMYGFDLNSKDKKYLYDGQGNEIDITTLKDLYNYLCSRLQFDKLEK